MRKGEKRKCLWGLTVKKLTRTQYGTQEKHQADGISSQQILRLFSCLNPPIWCEECAVSDLCSSLFQRCFDNASQLVVEIAFARSELGPGAGGLGACMAQGSSLQGQDLVPQGRSAFLTARLSPTEHRCPVGVLVLGAWTTYLLIFLAAMRGLSGNPGKGWEGPRYPARAADTSIAEEKDPFPHLKVSSFQGT